MGRRAAFPRLAARGPGAGVELAQTVASLLVAVGAAGVLAAGGLYPAGGLWQPLAAGGAGLAALGVLAAARRKAGRAPAGEEDDPGGFSSLHFAARYAAGWLLAVLALVFLCGGAGFGGKGVTAFLFALGAGAVHPALRVLRASAAVVAEEEGAVPLRLLAWIAVFRFAFFALAVCSVTSFLSGAILQAHEPYPTDPTFLLLALWLVAGIAILGGLSLLITYIGTIYGLRMAPRPLDDEPGPGETEPVAGRFHSEEF